MILVTGGTGQLGTAFKRLLPDAGYPPRAAFDLASAESMLEFLEDMEPTAIINCAGYTAVDRAEDEEPLAEQINGDAVGLLASYAAGRGMPFVTFSTDYVFPGSGSAPYVESDHPDPINAYGRSKRRGETLALAYSGALVIRTSWVISGTHPNFIATMLRLARTGDSFQVVDDQWGCPTITDDLANATLEAMDKGATGLLHLANRGPTTWFRLARHAVELAGLDVSKIAPCKTADYPLAAPRPAYSVLASERREALGIDSLPQWEESLPAVVTELLSAGL